MLPEILNEILRKFKNKVQLDCKKESRLCDYIVGLANSGGGIISIRCESDFFIDRNKIDPPIEISILNQGDLSYIIVPDGPLKPYSKQGKIWIFKGNELKIPKREDIISLIHLPAIDITEETLPVLSPDFFEKHQVEKLKSKIEELYESGVLNVFETSGLIKKGQPSKTLILLTGKRPDLYINGAYVVFKHSGGEIEKLTGNIPELIGKVSQLVLSKLEKVQLYQSLNYNRFRDCLKAILNEITANALIHKDYTVPIPVVVQYLDREIDIWNPGIPYNESDVPRPFSPYIRNPFLYKFAGIMGIINSSGSGLSIINKNSLLCNMDPVVFEKYQGGIMAKIGFRISAQSRRLNERERKLLEYIKNTGYITRKDYEKLMGVSERTARLDLSNLVKRGILKKVGKGKNTIYELIP